MNFRKNPSERHGASRRYAAFIYRWLAPFRSRLRRILGLLALACCFLPMAALGEEDAVVSPYGHEFPPIFAIQNDWRDFQAGAPPLKVIQALLQKDAQGKHVVPQEKSTYASVWVAVNRRLKQQPETLPALRLSQNSAAARQLFVAQRSGDPARLLAVYRKYPWADAVHESLIDTGERTLRGGQPQFALRCFQDALQRSEDAAVRARAQAGLWLAAAHSAKTAADISAMFRDADSAERYPWFGEQLSAKQIKAKLTAGMKPATQFPALDAISVRTLQLPDDPPWMGWIGYLHPTNHELGYRRKVQPVVAGRAAVVAGPCLLACYADGALDMPAWSKIATMDVSKNRGGTPPKPPFDPLVAEGRIYVRCGGDVAPAGQKRTNFIAMNHHAALNIDFLEYLAAFDQHSGQKIWSTADDADWAKLFPVNAPVYCDGRLYLLAMLKKAVKIHGWNGGGQVLIGGKEPIFLVIADAATGRLLQQRELVAYHRTFKPHNPTPDKKEPPMQIKKLDLTASASQRGPVGHTQLNVYGDKLTIRDGAVYVSTAMGAIARCDARDALVEWVTTYPQLSTSLHDTSVIRRRHGLAPLVSDRVVVVSPRDSVAIFAVDRETGAPLWQKTQIEDAAAGDPDTGDPDTAAASEKSAEGPADGELHYGSLEALGLFGDSVLVTFDHQLAALDVATGKVRWTRELDEPVERPIKTVGTTLYVATAMDLLKIDGATGKTLETRTLTPLRTDNGFVFDDKGLIIVKPGKHGITAYVDFRAGQNPFEKRQ